MGYFHCLSFHSKQIYINISQYQYTFSLLIEKKYTTLKFYQMYTYVEETPNTEGRGVVRKKYEKYRP